MNQLDFLDRIEEEDPYVLYVMVHETYQATQAEIIQAFTKAFAKMLKELEEEKSPALEAWVSGRIRKVVKRARNASLTKALGSSPVRTFCGEEGASTVDVFTPMRQSEQHKALKRLQVTGLEAPEGTYTSGTPYLDVQYDALLGMSTGKLVAQVGHAIQIFRMTHNAEDVEAWENSGHHITVSGDYRLVYDDDYVVVRDAGFTEVAAGSVTCVAKFVR